MSIEKKITYKILYDVGNVIWYDLKEPLETDFRPGRIFANVILGMRDFVSGAIDSSIQTSVGEFLENYEY